jgi:L-amino acid N-acyltransferase YncA
MIEARVYTRQRNTDKAQAEVVALGELDPDEISRRLDRGDALAMVYRAGEPAGYGWLSFSSGCVDLAFGFTWIVRPHEAVKYGNFVHPKWRGRGIQSSVNAAVNAYARDIGICRTLASISTLNTQSMSLVRHYRKPSTMNVTLVQFRAIHWTISRASGPPFESRFARPA